MTKEQEEAIQEFEKASVQLKDKGCKLDLASGGQGYENNYGKAYQRLVRLGLAPKLKKKYQAR